MVSFSLLIVDSICVHHILKPHAFNQQVVELLILLLFVNYSPHNGGDSLDDHLGKHVFDLLESEVHLVAGGVCRVDLELVLVQNCHVLLRNLHLFGLDDLVFDLVDG
jgi:hypothetical protein